MKEHRIAKLLLLAVSTGGQQGGRPADLCGAKPPTREAVTTNDAPKPIGPYSPAIKAGGFVFTSAQIAIDPATGKLVSGDIAAQTERVLNNLSAILRAAGTSINYTVKTTVFLKNMSDYEVMNDVYGRFFKKAPPGRSTVEVGRLPKNALVAIDVIAVVPVSDHSISQGILSRSSDIPYQ
jgi:2-iminobutanoate/2-iminopropanoate deaminase